MAIKISGTDAIDNNRRGLFNKVNPGSYTTSEANSLSKSEGDIIYNSSEKVLKVWNGSEWVSVGSDAGIPFVSFTGEEQIWINNGYIYAAWATGTGSISVAGGTLNLEALIIAGGGGGGAGRDGGGGGAGGVLVSTVQVPTASPAPVSVGGGGAAMPTWIGWSTQDPYTRGTRGTPSYVGSAEAIGGGTPGGLPPVGGAAPLPSSPGGSASGGNFTIGGGTGTPGQGNDGGAGDNIGGDPENSNCCGGGGGAGGAGQNGSAPSRTPGMGGAGLTIPQITPKNTLYPGVAWNLQYQAPLFSPGFAGGGSGHGGTFPYNPGTRPANPIGGGGAGRYPTGTPGSKFGAGGGGGGFRANTNSGGGNGYAGIVVIRYKIFI